MNHFGYHDSAARSGTAEPRRSRRSPLCLLPRAGNTRPPAQNHPRCAGPAAQDAAGAPRGHRGPRHRPGTATTLQQPQRRLKSHSVINAQRLFRCAGSVLNIHAKERKHAECKCLRSSKLRGHIYILIVENYKAKRAGRRLRLRGLLCAGRPQLSASQQWKLKGRARWGSAAPLSASRPAQRSLVRSQETQPHCSF